MNIIEQQGKTVDKAIEEGLKKLGVSKEKVQIEIIDKGKKGLLGLFGASPAIVKLTLIQDGTGIATQILSEVLRLMNIKSGITPQEKDGKLILDIVTADAQFLIGKNGQTIGALQYLINIMMKKNCRSKKDVILDIAQYQTKKDDNIVQLAVDAASHVIKTRRDVVLDPMGSHERQIIHVTLQNHRKVNTKSIGDGEERKVVVFLKKESNGNGKGRERNNYPSRNR
jgi:spoIIIJ-associated protein